MLIRDLLAEAGPGLRPVAVDDAALEVDLRAPYVTDLLDPGRYLQGGELVLTGLVWHRRPGDSETFVAALAGAGVAALAAGDAQLGGVPQDLADACRRHGLPLLGVDVDTSFDEVARCLVGASRTDRGERLAASLGRHRALLSALADGRPLEDVIAGVAAETGLRVRVLTPTGLQVVPGPEQLGTRDLDRMTRLFLTAPRLPAVTPPDGPAYSVLAVGPGLGGRLTSWMVAVDGDLADWPASGLEAVGELAAIVGLDRARREEGVRSLRPIHDDAVRLVTDRSYGGARDPETAVRLRQCGLDPSAPLAVVVAGFRGSEWREEERALLADAAAHVGPSVVAPAADGYTVAVVPADAPDAVDRLRTALTRLAPGLARTPLAVGVSEPSSLAGLSGMWEEARHAQSLAALGGEPVSVVTGGEVTSHVLLLAAVPDDVRDTFATRVLGTVEAYDARHEGGLLDTLEAWLGCSGSWSRTAAAMHLHVNTVRYRIGRVEELTGRDLSRLEDKVDVFLALRSLRR